ncbi:GGDEF domain-containing protein [Acholeplasma manati]|uniref:GGDEF domain-containing protein n=1 Tax=Paracholeplasma manati TaxID=591373 RepID=A0ABT2Y7K9_9MOLU|nr:GGDEF domain-containing protein [Paracholeplasma manati]MCV2231975.1 GGDEF domain-containing protein [Paracholeplasma manati]
MNNPYLNHVSKTLKEEFNVDVVEDILLVRKDRVILYGESNLSEDNILYVITGTLQLIGLAEASSIQLTDLLKRFEYNNAYADVAGKTDYYGYVYGELFSIRPQTSVTFPILAEQQRVWITVSRFVVDANPALSAYFITNVSDVMDAEEQNYAKSHRDSLTGLFNKYTLDFHYGKRYKNENFHVMYLDIDNFKEVNDHDGHVAGDQCLIAFSNILKSYSNDHKHFYRNGGDEFVGLLFDTEDHVREMAEGILSQVRQIQSPISNTRMTVSMGIVQADMRQDVIRKADMLLYKAKRMGKNQYIYEIEKTRQHEEA